MLDRTKELDVRDKSKELHSAALSEFTAPPIVPVTTTVRRSKKKLHVVISRVHDPQTGQLTQIRMRAAPGYAITDVWCIGPFDAATKTCRVGVVCEPRRGRPRKPKG